MRGEMTEVNVWDRILTEEEMTDIQTCRQISGGNVINWENSLIQVNNLTVHERDREEVCSYEKLVHISFPVKKDLEDSIVFCKKIGGDLAVASDEDKLSRIVSAYNVSRSFLKEFENFRLYAGFRKLTSNGNWLSVNNDGNLNWNNWELNHPQNKSVNQINCIVSRRWYNWKFVDSTCLGKRSMIDYSPVRNLFDLNLLKMLDGPHWTGAPPRDPPPSLSAGGWEPHIQTDWILCQGPA